MVSISQLISQFSVSPILTNRVILFSREPRAQLLNKSHRLYLLIDNFSIYYFASQVCQLDAVWRICIKLFKH